MLGCDQHGGWYRYMLLGCGRMELWLRQWVWWLTPARSAKLGVVWFKSDDGWLLCPVVVTKIYVTGIGTVEIPPLSWLTTCHCSFRLLRFSWKKMVGFISFLFWGRGMNQRLGERYWSCTFWKCSIGQQDAFYVGMRFVIPAAKSSVNELLVWYSVRDASACFVSWKVETRKTCAGDWRSKCEPASAHSLASCSFFCICGSWMKSIDRRYGSIMTESWLSRGKGHGKTTTNLERKNEEPLIWGAPGGVAASADVQAQVPVFIRSNQFRWKGTSRKSRRRQWRPEK